MKALVIKAADLAVIQDAIAAVLPEEGCGLLLGKGETVEMVIAVENELHSQVTFRMNPQAQLDALILAEDMGLEITGIFHSHPSGPDHPSETDIARFFYPGSAVIILSPSGKGWQCKAFIIEAGSYREIPVHILP